MSGTTDQSESEADLWVIYDERFREKKKLMEDEVALSITIDAITGTRDLVLFASVLKDIQTNWFAEQEKKPLEQFDMMLQTTFRSNSASMLKLINEQFPKTLQTVLENLDDITKKRPPEIKREFFHALMSFSWHMPRKHQSRLEEAFLNPVYEIKLENGKYRMPNGTNLEFSELKEGGIQIAGM
jgi:hypothetical protein